MPVFNLLPILFLLFSSPFPPLFQIASSAKPIVSERPVRSSQKCFLPVQQLFDHSEFHGLEDPTSVAVSPDSRFVYVGGGSDGSIGVFQSTFGGTEQKEFVKPIASYHQGVNDIIGLRFVSSIAVSADGFNLYATGKLDDSIIVFSRDPDHGALAIHQALLREDGDSDLKNLVGPEMVTISADGKYVFVVAHFSSSILIFERNLDSGKLSHVQTLSETDRSEGLEGARSLVVSKSGRDIFILGDLADTIVHYVKNEKYIRGRKDEPLYLFESKLTDEETEVMVKSKNEKEVFNSKDLPRGLANPRSLVLSPDEKFLYVSASDSNTITWYSLDADPKRRPVMRSMIFTSEVLRFTNGQAFQAFLRGVRHLSISPDGKFIFASSIVDKEFVVFSRNQTDGSLRFISRSGLHSDLIIVSPYQSSASSDGNFVYMVDPGSDSLVVFQWRPCNSVYDFVSQYAGFARKPLESLDHKMMRSHLSSREHQGVLKRLQQFRNNNGGVPGLDVAFRVDLSPSGRYAYTAGQNYRVLNVFTRDPTNGKLAFAHSLSSEDEFDFEGITSITSLSNRLSGDEIVIVGSSGAKAISVLRNNEGNLEPTVQFSFAELGEVRDFAIFLHESTYHLFACSFAESSDEEEPSAFLAHLTLSSDFRSLKLVHSHHLLFEGASYGSPRQVEIDTANKRIYIAFEDTMRFVAFQFNPLLSASRSLLFLETSNIFPPKLHPNDIQGNCDITSFTISPDTRQVYLTCKCVPAVLIYNLGENGGVSYFTQVETSQAPFFFKISPSGEYAFVASAIESTLLVFKRDLQTGELSYFHSIRDVLEDYDGLDGVNSIAISVDSQYIYTTSFFDDSLCVFQFFPHYQRGNSNYLSSLSPIHAAAPLDPGLLGGSVPLPLVGVACVAAMLFFMQPRWRRKFRSLFYIIG